MNKLHPRSSIHHDHEHQHPERPHTLYKLCSKAENRKAFAARIQAQFEKHEGITVEVAPTPMDMRGLTIRFKLDGFEGRINLSGGLASGDGHAFIMHWYTTSTTTLRLQYPSDFGFIARGSVNTCHYGKATTVVDTLEDLLNVIDTCMPVLINELRDRTEKQALTK